MNFANPAFQQFVSIALPIMVTIVLTFWTAQRSRNKRFDDFKTDMNRNFDSIERCLQRFDK